MGEKVIRPSSRHLTRITHRSCDSCHRNETKIFERSTSIDIDQWTIIRANRFISICLSQRFSRTNKTMSIDDDAKRFAQDRIQWILENQCRVPIRRNTPISFYYKTSANLIDEADFFYKGNQIEESFILYSRYITLFVEELKRSHPNYSNASMNDRERVKEIIRSKAFPRAEELKMKLKEKYGREYQEKQKLIQNDLIKIENCQNFVHRSAETKNLLVDRSEKRSFDSLRPMTIPNDIKTKFLQVAQNNTNRNIETCGILAGRKVDNEKNHYIVTHIIVPKQNGGPDSCDTEKEEEMIEYLSNFNLITLGWIHTHPSQTAFLSSVDLHTHLSYQMLLQEAIAIVISPKYDEVGIYSLTNDRGISVISTCHQTGFHEHLNNPPLYTNSTHTNYDSNVQCQIVDLRQ